MNFLKNLGFGGSANLGGLPYEIDTTKEAIEYANFVSEFNIYCGKSRPDNAVVSIFKSKQTASPTTSNALKRMKTLRHPNILAYLGGVEIAGGNIVIVTEEVVPLEYALAQLRGRVGKGSQEEARFFTWGLRSILTALNFINNDCRLIHGNLTPSSIFVTNGGDWKLGGFELCSEMSTSGPSSFFITHDHLVDSKYKSPERNMCDWRSMGNVPLWASDMWSLGCTYYCVQNGRLDSSEEAQHAKSIPQTFDKLYRQMMVAQPHKRINPMKALQDNYFDDDYVRTLIFIEELAIKDQTELVDFCRKLPSIIDTFPQMCSLYKILPSFKKHIELGGAGGSQVHPSASFVLPLMLKIGTLMAPEEFKLEVLPIVVRLFGSSDRALRVQLLQMMETFAEHLDENLVNKTIFDSICSGFGDTAPILRELTVKSMLHISQKLNRKNLNERLMKYFAKMQVDPEPAIRTNTTICLGRVAPFLEEKTRGKVLLPAFCRALRDPFPHARFAGIRALCACEQYIDLNGLANSAMPVICSLLLDPTSFVRDEAFTAMDLFMKKLQTHSAALRIEEQKQQEIEEQKREEEISKKCSDLPLAQQQQQPNNNNQTTKQQQQQKNPSTESLSMNNLQINSRSSLGGSKTTLQTSSHVEGISSIPTNMNSVDDMRWDDDEDGWDDFSPVAKTTKTLNSNVVIAAATMESSSSNWSIPESSSSLPPPSSVDLSRVSKTIKQNTTTSEDDFFGEWGEVKPKNQLLNNSDTLKSSDLGHTNRGSVLKSQEKNMIGKKETTGKVAGKGAGKVEKKVSKMKKSVDGGWDDWED